MLAASALTPIGPSLSRRLSRRYAARSIELRTCPTPPSRVCSARRANTATSCCSVSRRPGSPTVDMSIDISGVVGMAGAQFMRGSWVGGQGTRPGRGATGAAQTRFAAWSHPLRTGVNCETGGHELQHGRLPARGDAGRRPGRPEDALGRRARHRDGGQQVPVAAGRHTGAPEVREPPADRFVQAARRICAHRRAAARGRAAGVVAASAGNHAQGVALASSLLGVHSTVFMPKGAPLPKISATREYGADVRLYGQVVDDSLAAAQEYAAETGAVLIHPFDHPDVVAGQGRWVWRSWSSAPRCAPSSWAWGRRAGGGVATAVKALRPDVRVVGVQAEGAAAYPPSLAPGARCRWRTRRRWPTDQGGPAR